MENNKRGVSETVSVVLISLIAISLVAIIFMYIIEFSAKPLQFSPQMCIEMQGSPSTSIESSCYNHFTGDLELTLSRGIDQYELTSVKASTHLETGRSESWVCEDSCGTCKIIQSGEKKTYYIPVSGKPERAVITINDCVELTESAIQECN